MNPAKWTIRRPVATLMMMMAVMLIGGVSLFNLKLDLLPAINPPVLAVITELPGATAREVMALVTEPVEAVAATTGGIKSLRSVTREGTSFVILQFEWDIRMSEARTELAEKLELVPLPGEAGKPQIFKFDPTLLPLMQVYIAADGELSLEELTALVNRRVRPRLEAVPGVAAAGLTGGTTREVRIEAERSRLNATGIGLSRLAGMVAQAAANLPAGEVTGEGREKSVRLLARPETLADLEDIPVGMLPGTGQVIRVADLAAVSDTVVPGESVARLNGNPALGILIQKEGSGNTVAVARRVRGELARIGRDIPQLNMVVMLDQGRFIEDALRSTAVSLVAGGFFAMAVLLAFLGSIISTAIVAIAVPFSILATFALMYLSGMTLNIMTLGGLALGVGMLVDNSIVVMESIYRRRQEGEEPDSAAEQGSGEVAGAITASTITTLVVFLPVVFVGGLTGTIFRELAVTVTYALLASLAVSLTVIPLLAARWLRYGDNWGRERRDERLAGAIPRFALRHRRLILACAAVLFALSMLALPRIGTEFLPVVDEGVFTVDLRLPVATPLAETVARAGQYEQELMALPEVDKVTTQAGGGGGFAGVRAALRGGASNAAQLIVTLAETDKTTARVMEEAREAVGRLKKEDEEVVINLHSSLFFAPGSSASLLQLTVDGPDPDMLRQVAAMVARQMEGIAGLVNVSSGAEARVPELRVMVRGADALLAGLTPGAVGQELSRALRGQVAGRMKRGEETVYIRVILREEDRSDVDDLLVVPLQGAVGRLVPLGLVAEVVEGEGPVSITRTEQKESVEVAGQIEGRDIGTLLAEAMDRVAELDLPSGYSVSAAGTAVLMEQGFGSLRGAFLLSLVLIYMVLATRFESLRAPLAIILTAPLAAAGVVASLLATRTTFGITAFIGVIILGGVVVNNGIVLVDMMEKLRSRGAGLSDAVTEAVRQRMRPVLMTAFTTVLGLLPLALALGEGTELQAPLARVVIGGLLSATLLTLVVIPALYTYLLPAR